MNRADLKSSRPAGNRAAAARKRCLDRAVSVSPLHLAKENPLP